MSQSNDERTVVLSDVKGSDAGAQLRRESVIGGVGDAVLYYKKVKDYTTFEAEYALNGRDLVIHFFLPKELRPPEGGRLTESVSPYWLRRFPSALDSTAREYFQADAPRLQAKYTEELFSWWFRAQGYDHLVDLEGFVHTFFARLDYALEHQE